MKAQLNRCCVKIVAVAFAVALLPACVLANTTNSLSATVQEELEKQPVARLAFSSAEHLSDAIFEIGSEQFRLAFEGLFDKFFSAVDKQRPIGFYAYAGEKFDKPEFLVCIPVTNSANFKETLSEYGFEFQKSVWGTLLNTSKGRWYVRQNGNYLMFSNVKQRVEVPPVDCENEFKTLLADSSIALNFDNRKIPLEWKEQAWKIFQLQVLSASPELRLDNRFPAVQIRELMFDMEQVDLRAKLDTETKNLSFDFQVHAKPDSRMANRAAQDLSLPKSNFAGFGFNKSGLNVRYSSNAPAEGLLKFIADTKETVLMLKGEQVGPEAMSLLQEFDSIVASAFGSKVDSAGSLVTVKGQSHVVVGMFVEDGERCNKFLDMCIEFLESQPEKIRYRKNIATHKGVSFHQFIGKPSRSTFDPKITVGIGPQAVYYSQGKHGLDLIKACIDKSAKHSDKSFDSTFHFHLRVARLVSMNASPRMMELLKPALDRNQGQDVVQVKSRSIKNGYSATVSIDFGALDICVETISQIGAIANAEFKAIADSLDDANSNQPFEKFGGE